MKALTVIIVAVILIRVAFYLIKLPIKKEKKENTFSTVDTSKYKRIKKPDGSNPYFDLRSNALNVSAGDLELTLSENYAEVYGVVMDWDMGDVVSTLASYSTGDASVYFNYGGGVIGGGQHSNVSAAAKIYITKAQQYLSKAKPCGETSLPNKNCVKFYFLTNRGKYMVEEKFENFNSNVSVLTPLFTEANIVMSELRKTSDVSGQ